MLVSAKRMEKDGIGRKMRESGRNGGGGGKIAFSHADEKGSTHARRHWECMKAIVKYLYIQVIV